AVRLHKSQPAVSHALAHLRELFGDPLLVRRGGKLALTARARELSQPLEDVLDQLGALLAPPAFDAAAAQRVFRLVMSDYGARTVLPELIRRLRA
ncbi:LysR family transcriptional regulator, partial [Acinetobacter baumannii]